MGATPAIVTGKAEVSYAYFGSDYPPQGGFRIVGGVNGGYNPSVVAKGTYNRESCAIRRF